MSLKPTELPNPNQRLQRRSKRKLSRNRNQIKKLKRDLLQKRGNDLDLEIENVNVPVQSDGPVRSLEESAPDPAGDHDPKIKRDRVREIEKGLDHVNDPDLGIGKGLDPEIERELGPEIERNPSPGIGNARFLAVVDLRAAQSETLRFRTTENLEIRLPIFPR